MKKKPEHVIVELFKTISSRKNADPEKSYTAKLYQKGTKKICQKIGEEASEVIIAALTESRKELIAESADLMYHLMVLWADKGVTVDEVAQELFSRQGMSGLEEKKKRPKAVIKKPVKKTASKKKGK